MAKQIAQAMQRLRTVDLFKPPCVAEALDWAAALRVLGADTLTSDVVDETIGVVLKYQEDIERVREDGLQELLS